MVNFEAAKSVAPSLLTTGKQWLLESIQNVASSSHRDEASPSSSSSPQDQDLDQTSKQQQAASTEYLVHNWLESLFAWFQMIILWHEPLMSLCAISCILTSFLLLTYFAPKFYAIIMIAVFIYNLNKFWFRHVWPDIRVPPGAEREDEMRLDVDRFTYLHPQLMTVAELGHHIENIIQASKYYLSKTLQFRQRRPVAFCSIICTILSCAVYIGNRISGTSLVFWIITLVMTAPGIYHHLLPELFEDWLKKNLLSIWASIHKKNHSPNNYKEDTTLDETQDSLSKQSATMEHDNVESSSTTTIAQITKTQALSLFEHIKKKSFNFGASNDRNTMLENAIIDSHSDNKNDQQKQGAGFMTTVPSPTIDVPRSDQAKSADQQQRQRRYVQDEKDSSLRSDCVAGVRGADCSSNSSVSLIDSDEEQQDGFVLL